MSTMRVISVTSLPPLPDDLWAGDGTAQLPIDVDPDPPRALPSVTAGIIAGVAILGGHRRHHHRAPPVMRVARRIEPLVGFGAADLGWTNHNHCPPGTSRYDDASACVANDAWNFEKRGSGSSGWGCPPGMMLQQVTLWNNCDGDLCPSTPTIMACVATQAPSCPTCPTCASCPPTPTCPSCQPQPAACPTGQARNNAGACVSFYPPCPTGQGRNAAGACVSTWTPCPAGFARLANGSCVSTTCPTCPPCQPGQVCPPCDCPEVVCEECEIPQLPAVEEPKAWVLALAGGIALATIAGFVAIGAGG